MAEGRDNDELFWVDPQRRGILPLNGFHISRSLRKHIRTAPYQVSFDKAFGQVVRSCADREETWINSQIEQLYNQLFDQGHAHSVEIWESGDLIGGVYGVSIGGAFFGESMFSTRTNASKVAMTYLTDRLNFGGFALFDTQFLTDHLASLGAIEISRQDYHRLLVPALALNADFNAADDIPSPQEVLQRNSQMS